MYFIYLDHPDTKTGRTLTLIAKCLMTLASHSSMEQNPKEPWMVRLNEFVQVHLKIGHVKTVWVSFLYRTIRITL